MASCDRSPLTEQFDHKSKLSGKIWKQSLRRGYIEQAFRRVTVRESLQHGVDNAPYLQRTDARRKAAGKANTYKKLKEGEPDSSTMRQLCEALGSPTPTPP